MNYAAAQEHLWRLLGKHDSNGRRDYMVEQVREAVNAAVDRLKNEGRELLYDIRQGTVSLVSGTSTYDLDDFCLMPITFYTVSGNSPGELEPIIGSEVDALGLRSPSLYQITGSVYHFTWKEFRQTASKSTTSNISGTAITRTSGDSFAATDVGRRVRINGERPDYTVAAYVSTDAVTLSRSYVARRTGEAVSSDTTTATAATVELSPPPVRQLEIVPACQTSLTLYYKYIRQWPYLLGDSEVLPVEQRWDEAVIDLAYAEIMKWTENHEAADRAEARAQRWLTKMKEIEQTAGRPPRLMYRSPIRDGPYPKESQSMVRDTYRRGRPWR
jgi:hypothetical protein